MARLRIMVNLLFILFVAWAGSAAAAAPDAAASHGEISSFSVAETERLGREIYRLDKAAAQATDFLIAKGIDLRRGDVVGWITEPTEGGVRVRYLRNQGETVVPFYDVLFGSAEQPVEVVLSRDTALTVSQSAQFSARQLALLQVKEPCSPAYNTVVLRHPERDAWLVYALAATNQPGVVVAGGHYRMTVSGDGRQLISVDRLSRSCLTFPPKPANVVGVFMTHVLTPTPIETHVFLSLLHRHPVIVGTSEGRWVIENGAIRRLVENPQR